MDPRARAFASPFVMEKLRMGLHCFCGKQSAKFIVMRKFKIKILFFFFNHLHLLSKIIWHFEIKHHSFMSESGL